MIGDENLDVDPPDAFENAARVKQNKAMLMAGWLAGKADLIDVEALEDAYRANPGPPFYTEMMRVTLTFLRDLKRVRRELEHQRLKVDVLPFIVPRGGDGGPS
ncbi:MAG TPA: hypothetical protein VFC78_22045 [Tepidisphaeraceae bacterium]|nr:hypothetical protein [Tepidisphaeraceae bacterium]